MDAETMDNSSSSSGIGGQIIEAADIDAEVSTLACPTSRTRTRQAKVLFHHSPSYQYITLAAPVQGSTVRVVDSPLNDDRLQSVGMGNLFSISNVFGWAVVVNESTPGKRFPALVN
jgi:hypothetical protein